MDVKTLSAMLGHVSAATTLDIYTHITDDMQRTAAANIDRGIGKTAPPEGGSEPRRETATGLPDKPRMTDFKPVMSRRRAGTGCITQINGHIFEGRYSPMWIDGKKHSRNVYAKTREECEEKCFRPGLALVAGIFVTASSSETAPHKQRNKRDDKKTAG